MSPRPGPKFPSVQIAETEFLFGAPHAEDIRPQHLPEIAVIGRSNVGKSSFVNRLLGRTVARVSSTPGRTQQLNFFRVRGRQGDRSFNLALVDLPGFGFAKLSKGQREDISRSVVSYLDDREQLSTVLLLNDCRRLPEADEISVQTMCGESGIHCLVIITKMDALRRSEQDRSIKTLAEAYRLEPADLICTGKDVPNGEVWSRILAVM